MIVIKFSHKCRGLAKSQIEKNDNTIEIISVSDDIIIYQFPSGRIAFQPKEDRFDLLKTDSLHYMSSIFITFSLALKP